MPSAIVYGEIGADLVHPDAEITVKVKANMKFSKIFAAAEVSPKNTCVRRANLTFATQQRFGKEPG